MKITELFLIVLIMNADFFQIYLQHLQVCEIIIFSSDKQITVTSHQ